MKYIPGDILVKTNRFIFGADATLGGRMNFNYNRKLAYFPFVVYWRHYG